MPSVLQIEGSVNAAGLRSGCNPIVIDLALGVLLTVQQFNSRGLHRTSGPGRIVCFPTSLAGAPIFRCFLLGN